MLTKKRQTRKNRIRSKLSGTAKRPRLVVFRSNKHIYAQIIDDSTGKTLLSLSDSSLKDEKGTKIQKAEKLGEKLAEMAKKNKIEKVVFDRAGYKYHGRIKALAQKAREAGLIF